MSNSRADLENWSKSVPAQADLIALAKGSKNDGEPLLIDRYTVSTANTPAPKLHLFSRQTLFDLWVWLQTSDPLYISGPTGCGKSAVVEQLAARLGIPVFNLIGSFDTDVHDFYGSRTAVNGTVFYEYGPLSLAYRYGGIFLLDEIDGLNPALALGLNTVLDGRPLVLPETGEIIHKNPRFRFIATANTNGGNDETGVYQGTNRLNLAFMDRFHKLVAAYPSEEMERLMLLKYAPDVKPAHAAMLKFARLVREGFLNPDAETQLDVTFSTRSLLRWAGLLNLYTPMKQSLNILEYTMLQAVGHMASQPCQVALKEILGRVSTPLDFKDENGKDSEN
jgi:cobaltochelatase CobS